MKKSSAPAGSTLAEILSAVKNTNLAEVVIPSQGRKCKHFVAFGQVDEFTRKLFAYAWQLTALLKNDIEGMDQLVAEINIDMPRGNDADLKKARAKKAKEIRDQFDPYIGQTFLMLKAVDSLIRLEMIRQFPAALNRDLKHFFVDIDWTVGWIDHDPAKVVADAMRSIFGDGVEVEMVSPGGPPVGRWPSAADIEDMLRSVRSERSRGDGAGSLTEAISSALRQPSLRR